MDTLKGTTLSAALHAIELVNARFMETFAKGDARGLAACYTRDATILPPGADLVHGADNILKFWQEMIGSGIKKLELETVNTEELGPVVCEIGRCRVYGDEDQLVDEAKFIVLWRQENGEWKVYRDIWNSSRKVTS